MLIQQDAIELGPVPIEILNDLQTVTPTIDWTNETFDRRVDTLPTRIVRVPYSVRKEPEQEQTKEVVQVLDAFKPVDKWMRSKYANFTFIKCEINWLLPNDMLPYHRDPTWWHEHSHRIHIPVITNPNCFWLVEGRETHLEVGKHYEINNRRFHSMVNRGTTPRLHLVFDLIENERYQEVLDKNIDINQFTCSRVYYNSTEECLAGYQSVPDYLQDYQQ